MSPGLHGTTNGVVDREDLRLNDDSTEAQRPLRVQVCELYARDNAAQHHTERFDAAVSEPYTPILRRGQPFMLALAFDRRYDPKRDAVQFLFKFESKQGTSKGISQLIQVKENAALLKDNGSWDAAVQHEDPRDPTQTFYKVMIPPKAKVGVWRLVVLTQEKNEGGGRSEYRSADPIYILFNPWCKDDDVYMENPAWREEYVLNDHGKVWRSSKIGLPWAFGQFDENVLPCVMELLRLSGISAIDRGNPVLVTRAISRAVNSNDDKGLIFGKWAKDVAEFSAGTVPWKWTGTVAIMQKFMKTKEPVKYGQCWVYAAATVTVCRALGIPCRAVTTYGAAHDSDNSLTIDRYIDRNGEYLKQELVWNFHVWNDVWMARPDLPQGYGGWQAIDATPQERSQGKYQCGPAPVEAVRRGFVGLGNDAHFVFCEVNGDVFYYIDKGQSDWKTKPSFINTEEVGYLIVTKKVGVDDDNGNSDMENITNEYKFLEGTRAERLAKMNAVRTSEYPAPTEKYGKPSFQDVVLQLPDAGDVMLGEDLALALHVHNTSAENRQVSYVLQSNALDFRGNKCAALKRADNVVNVLPGRREKIELVISTAEYFDKIREEGSVNLLALVEVKETKQIWVKETTVALQKPQLNIEVQGQPKVGREITVNFSFKNPLNKPLTKCKYRLEGPGLLQPKSVAFRSVMPGELVQWKEKIVPRLAGQRKLVVNFYSGELVGVTGRASLDVLPA